MEYAIAIIAVASIVTIFLRALPFLMFGGKKEINPTISYLGEVLPPAIMVILVVYCLKSINIFEGSRGLPEFISIAVVVIMHVWKKNTLLSILVGTVLYMFLIQKVFI